MPIVNEVPANVTPAVPPAAVIEPPLDLARLRAYRLDRVRAQLLENDCAACVLFDPINIRYATDSRNMSVWCLHNPARYCFIALDGTVILFEFHGCGHLADGIDQIDEIRQAQSWFFFSARVHGLRNTLRAGPAKSKTWWRTMAGATGAWPSTAATRLASKH
jgi:hypothetical protein